MKEAYTVRFKQLGPAEAWNPHGVIYLLAPIGGFFSAFFSTVGKEAGKDAYQGIRRLLSRLFGARRNSNGSVELWDDHARTHIILTANLPEEAYAKLIRS